MKHEICDVINLLLDYIYDDDTNQIVIEKIITHCLEHEICSITILYWTE